MDEQDIVHGVELRQGFADGGGVVHIIGGGTVAHVRPHLAIAAPAYGWSARRIADLCRERWSKEDTSVELHLTRMACGEQSAPETNEDVRKLLRRIVDRPSSKVVFMPVALCDYEGAIMDGAIASQSGKDMPRLKTRDGDQMMHLTPADKLIGDIRSYRKDLFLVGFKTTTGATPEEQYLAGLELLKKNSCKLVLANDLHTKLNMVITPEQARYHETKDRMTALRGLVEMAYLRSKNRFTRSTVVHGDAVPWDSPLVPASLRTVVDHCIARGAYKPFLGATVGHFAVKVGEGRFLTSRRKVDFNRLPEVGLVMVETRGHDRVVAHGFKPSVGGQSQRIVFTDHPDADCIVHFHCPLRPGSRVPVRSQRAYECGSHECGRNTSQGLERFGNLYAVFLDQHGPNVVFSRDTDPREVIDFIEANFELEAATDGALKPVHVHRVEEAAAQ